MAKTTTTRAPRRSAEQIARDELAMTEKKLSLVITRLDRLAEEELKARAEKVHLQTLRELPGRSSTARPAAH